MKADHDNSYKLMFSHAELVRDLLTGFVDEPWLAELDLDTLEKANGSYVADFSATTCPHWATRWRSRPCLPKA